MAISFRCVKEDCRKLLSAPDDWPGRRIECPVCHTSQRVPAQSGGTGVAMQADADAKGAAGAATATGTAHGAGQRAGADAPAAADPRFARRRQSGDQAMPEGFFALLWYRLQAGKGKILIFAGALLMLSTAGVVFWLMSHAGQEATRDVREQVNMGEKYFEAVMSAPDKARAAVGKVHLRNLHTTLVMYAQAHGGKFPRSLEDLPQTMGISPELIRTGRDHTEPLGYVPGLTQTSTPDFILVYTPPKQGIRTVLMVSGQVTAMVESYFHEHLAAQQAPPHGTGPTTQPAAP